MWFLTLQEGIQRAFCLWRSAQGRGFTLGHLWQGPHGFEGNIDLASKLSVKNDGLGPSLVWVPSQISDVSKAILILGLYWVVMWN